jgi:hypothetical protein
MHHSSDIGSRIDLLLCPTKRSPRVEIRITPDRKYASVIDIIRIVSDSTRPRAVWERQKQKMYKLQEKQMLQEIPLTSFHHFNGERQRPTPVVSSRGLIELLHLIPGEKAYEIRRQHSKIFIWLMDADKTAVMNLNGPHSIEGEISQG